MATTLPRFKEFPTEVQLKIWKKAIPGPRIVDFRLGRLKATPKEWYSTESVLDESDPRMKSDSNDDDFLDAYSQLLDTTHAQLPGLPPYLPAIKSVTPPPQALLACKDSSKVFLKHYTKAFRSLFSMPETFFDFQQDTFFLNYDTFTKNARPFQMDQNGKLSVVAGLRSLNRCEDLARVKQLALMFCPSRCQQHYTRPDSSLEDEVAEVLSLFSGVRKLTILYEHVNLSDNDNSPISFVELEDINKVINGSSAVVELVIPFPSISEWTEYFLGQLEKAIRERSMNDNPFIPEVVWKASITEGMKAKPDIKHWVEKWGL